MKRPELLCPAKGIEELKTAVIYGADAVYIGGEVFSLRANAKNFTDAEMAEGIAFAHERGAKVYVTANILAHDDDIEKAKGFFEDMRVLGPDGLIIADPMLKRLVPFYTGAWIDAVHFAVSGQAPAAGKK